MSVSRARCGNPFPSRLTSSRNVESLGRSVVSDQMFFRRTTAVVAVFALPLVLIAASGVVAQTSVSPESMTAAQMAAGIAHTIDVNTSKTDRGPLAFDAATAQGNVVEVHYTAHDAGFFAANKSNASVLQRAFASYFCDSSRISYLNRGVVIHEVLASPDNTDEVDAIIDRETCSELLHQ